MMVCLICFVFKYRNGSVVSVVSISYDDILIQRALEQMTTCKSKDRSRHEHLLRSLLVWIHFADAHNIQYWLGYGSLVGYVQRRGLLPHDHDIDLLMLADETAKLVPYSNANLSDVHILRVHPQWQRIGLKSRKRYPSKGINFKAPNARLKYRNRSHYVDIWPIYNYIPGKRKTKSNMTTVLTQYDKFYKWLSSPVSWTFPLQPCEFSGMKVWCPAMPDRIVSMLYGAESLNKSNRACVNGSWVKVKL